MRDDGEIEPGQVDELTWQGIEGINPAEGVVVIIPLSKLYGVSLWGTGDDELVQAVFEIDRNSATVTACNQCDSSRTATDRRGGTVLVIPTRLGARPAVECIYVSWPVLL